MTVIVLTAASGATWTVPNDWNSASNTIEAIGAGGRGANAVLGVASGGGGGGGEYRKINNASFVPGNTVDINVALGGAGSGAAGSWVKNGSGTIVIEAKNGSNGSTSANAAGGTGGTGAGGNYNGGSGTWASGNGGGGGGGSAGPTGAGKNGGNNAGFVSGGGGGGSNGGSSSAGSNAASGNNGGAGGNGTGGTGGGSGGVSTGSGGNGSSGGGGGGAGGSNSSATAGTGGADSSLGGGTYGVSGGGGGGGGSTNFHCTNGATASYGGGGGGGGRATGAIPGAANGGNGGNGLIVITYTPVNNYILAVDPVGYEYTPADVDLTFVPNPDVGDTHDGFKRRSRRERALEAAERRRRDALVEEAVALRLSLEAAMGMAAEAIQSGDPNQVAALDPRTVDAVERNIKRAAILVPVLSPVSPDATYIAAARETIAALRAAVDEAARARALAEDDEEVMMLLRAL